MCVQSNASKETVKRISELAGNPSWLMEMLSTALDVEVSLHTNGRYQLIFALPAGSTVEVYAVGFCFDEELDEYDLDTEWICTFGSVQEWADASNK